VEIIIAISCKGLLFCGATHTDSSLSLYYLSGGGTSLSAKGDRPDAPPLKNRGII
jgi:hypothetical protein